MSRLSIAATVIALGAALLVPASGPAQARAQAVPPTVGADWPLCSADPDGQYCIVSATMDGATYDPDEYQPQAALIGAGDVVFSLYRVHDGGATLLFDAEPGHTWVFRLNTGTIRPSELDGTLKNPGFSVSGGGAGGYVTTVTFQPAPVSNRLDASICRPNACGTVSTKADYTYPGFANGYVTNRVGSGLEPAEIAARRGMISSSSAQYAGSPFYNPDTNALEVQLANVHLTATGGPVVGFYQVFLPNAYLMEFMQVPDPSTLTGGSFTVSRSDSSATVPFSVVKTPAGLWVRIDAITFSSPKLRIKPRASAPGVPRIAKVKKLSAGRAKVRFAAPIADGGRKITGYQARCRKGKGVWHKAGGAQSPIVVGHLPRGKATCQVRAINKVGKGRWSAVVRSS